jgi:DNA polymerase-3 subunit delta'
MLAELERHPHARSLLGPVMADGGKASHAYLFHGPGGAGKRAAARALAAQLLAEGATDPAGARARALSGAHPDLTWVAPSGAHEILVGDIAEPVVAASARTPFEASRRVFVIERVDELGDEAANRILKTLEEPPGFAHLVLITDRLAEVLPTIRSRCQLVRFDAPSEDEVAASLQAAGASPETALACARLSLGDAERARELLGEEGAALRAAGEALARAAAAGEVARAKPCDAILAAVRARGEPIRAELEERAAAEAELSPRKERKRIETEWSDRIRRSRRRVETGALDLALQIAALWFGDLACLSWGAADLVRNRDRGAALAEDAARSLRPEGLWKAIELVEDTRRRFQLNVTEELACEALALRLEEALSR